LKKDDEWITLFITSHWDRSIKSNHELKKQSRSETADFPAAMVFWLLQR